jgi:ABC-type phosphate transport system substrate-binding protein
VLLLARGLWAQEPAFKVVVNAVHPATTIRRAQLVDVFLKKVNRWGDGTAIQPVDLSTKSPVRASFSKDGLGQSVDAVVNYWQRQILAGRDRPPIVKSSDEEVIAFVGSIPGGVGYVSAAATLSDKVKAIKITE